MADDSGRAEFSKRSVPAKESRNPEVIWGGRGNLTDCNKAREPKIPRSKAGLAPYPAFSAFSRDLMNFRMAPKVFIRCSRMTWAVAWGSRFWKASSILRCSWRDSRSVDRPSARHSDIESLLPGAG